MIAGARQHVCERNQGGSIKHTRKAPHVAAQCAASDTTRGVVKWSFSRHLGGNVQPFEFDDMCECHKCGKTNDERERDSAYQHLGARPHCPRQHGARRDVRDGRGVAGVSAGIRPARRAPTQRKVALIRGRPIVAQKESWQWAEPFSFAAGHRLPTLDRGGRRLGTFPFSAGAWNFPQLAPPENRRHVSEHAGNWTPRAVFRACRGPVARPAAAPSVAGRDVAEAQTVRGVA